MLCRGLLPVLMCLIVMPGIPADDQGMAPLIVAHRGAAGERPENTLPAFARAVEQGAGAVEVDVRMSCDGRLFVLHDEKLERTTDGKGPAAALTWEALGQLDAGSWFGPEYAGERIPGLGEVLAWGRDRTVVLLDLKEDGRAFADAVAEEVRRFGNPEKVVIGVRSPRQATEFHERLPECRQMGFMPAPEDIEAFAEAGVDLLRLWLNWLEQAPTLAARVRKAGKLFMVNGSSGNPTETRRLMQFAPDWVLIDDIPQFRRSLIASVLSDTSAAAGLE